MIGRFWRGLLPRTGTFWLGWALPFAVTCTLLGNGGWWLINNLGLLTFYAIVAALLIYLVVAVVPVWRASAKFEGSRLYVLAARAVAVMGAGVPALVIGSIVVSLVALKLGLDDTHDPDRTAEKLAVPSPSHPMAGFWKIGCKENFGLAIAPADGPEYSVSFCGPGGCFKPGSYRPNTTLIDDKNYEVVDSNTLRVYGCDGWSPYVRSASREAKECSQEVLQQGAPSDEPKAAAAELGVIAPR